MEIHLTPIEYKLLCLFGLKYREGPHPQFYPQRDLGAAPPFGYPLPPRLHGHSAQKLEVDPSHPQYIQTHIGVGYRMIRQKQEDEA